MGKKETNVWIPTVDQQEHMGSQPYVGSPRDFGVMKNEELREKAPLVSIGHCEHLDLLDPDDRERMATIMETVANTSARIVYHHVREEDWTAVVSWIGQQREPEDKARERQVNLVQQSNEDRQNG